MRPRRNEFIVFNEVAAHRLFARAKNEGERLLVRILDWISRRIPEPRKQGYWCGEKPRRDA